MYVCLSAIDKLISKDSSIGFSQYCLDFFVSVFLFFIEIFYTVLGNLDYYSVLLFRREELGN